MKQSLFGLARPNTSVYLEDLERYRKLGVGGVVYACFEPGVRLFVPQLDAMARAMWGENPRHAPGPFERAYRSDPGADADQAWTGRARRWGGWLKASWRS
jgi:hypothetical protein